MTHVSPFLASEIAALIGTPWQEGAVGPEAYDCWAAAAMVEERFFGRVLPRLGADRRAAITRARATWRTCASPRDGDIVEMRRMGRANHVGVWIAGAVLHCQRGAGMVYDRPDAIRAMGWQMRFWTPGAAHAARRKGPRAAASAIYVPGLDLLMGGRTPPEALIAAHRAVPIEARAGETVADVIARAGLGGEHLAVFLRPFDAPVVADVADVADVRSDQLETLLRDLGAVPEAARGDTVIPDGYRLVITQMPQGGRGTNPLHLVLQIAVLAAAAYFAPALGGKLGGLAGSLGFASGRQLAFGAISLIGGFVINAILPPPSPPALTGFAEEVSPTFSARAQSAIARPGAPIPVQFGRHIHQLDDISPPFVRFIDNAQIVYQLLCLGMGEHALEEVRLGDVTVWKDGAATGTLPGIEIEHIRSGEAVTLMDEAVWTQGDVTGLALEPQATIGWHAAVPAGRSAVAVEVDIAFQQLVTIDTNGNNQSRSVDIRVEAQMIDDDDTALGDPVELELLSFTGATRSALRSSHKWFVPEGRWRLRLTRLTAEGGNQTFDTAIWAGLKGIFPAGRIYQGMELLAVRAEVGEAFAAQSARQVRAVKTRKLPVWDGVAWSAPQPTREIAWAVAEIARMHGRLDDLDMAELMALHDIWVARGDRFDTVFDQSLSFWEALQTALRAGRAQPDQLGRRIRIWRDAPQPIPRQLFCERNIRRGSLSIRPRLPVSARPERLVAQFMDARTWRPAEIAVGAITGRERRERYFGITDHDHLLREVGHDFRAARFRSVTVAFEAELENRLLRRGDPVVLSHRELTEGVAVGLEAWEGLDITLGQEIDTGPGTAPLLMRLSAPDGTVIGPVAVQPALGGARADRITVSQDEMDRIIADHGTDPRDWVARDHRRDEPVRAVIGAGAEATMRLLVVEVGEERDGYAPVTCVDDDPRAHDLPVAASGGLDGVIFAFAFEVIATPQGDEVTILTAILNPEAGMAVVFEYSTDGGTFWQPLGTGSVTTLMPRFTFPAPAGLSHVRAAVTLGGARGPWVLAESDLSALAAPEGLAEVEAGQFAAEARLHVAAAPVAGATSYRFTLLDGAGQVMAILARATPALDLDADGLRALAALSRMTTVRVAAIDSGFQTGPAAELALQGPPPPGVPTGFFQFSNGVVTWQNGTPPATSWRVEWPGGSATTLTPEFWRGTAGWADPLTFVPLDAFGAGAATIQSFLPAYEPPPGGDGF